MARENNHRNGIPSYILDDLSTRFLNNLPEEEYSDLVRVFFQVEQAYWFFLDFYCNKSGIKACAIKDFSEQIFRHCPVLVNHYSSYEDILRSWREYKLTVPRYGIIILDPSMEKCLLVRGMGSHSSWTFPKGKINEGESEVDCAIRETEEEIGYDTTDLVDAHCYLEHKMNDQYNKLYIVKDVPLDTHFQTKTRNEIRSIKWWTIANLPSEHGNNSFLFVYPFVKKLRTWIENQRYPNSKRHRSAFRNASSGNRIASGSLSSSTGAIGLTKTANGNSSGNLNSQSAAGSQGNASSRRKYVLPVASGLGRGQSSFRNNQNNFLVGGGSDDDNGGKPYQPFQQIGGLGSAKRKSLQAGNSNASEASPLALKSLFPDSNNNINNNGGNKNRANKRLSKQRHRNSLSGGGTTSGDEVVSGHSARTGRGGAGAGKTGHRHMVTNSNTAGHTKEPTAVRGAIAISRSALGLIAPDDIEREGMKLKQETDGDAETDTQPVEEEVADDDGTESDDEDEGDDDSGGGYSADDAYITSMTAKGGQANGGRVTTWQNYIPECWKNFSFDRNAILQAWPVNNK